MAQPKISPILRAHALDRALGRCTCRGQCGRHERKRCDEQFGQSGMFGRKTTSPVFVFTTRRPIKATENNVRAVCPECARTWDPGRAESARRARDSANTVLESYLPPEYRG